MNFLLRVWGLLTIIPSRLFSQWGLVLAAILGLVSSLSLILSIPLYADSIYYQTLQTNLTATDDGTTIPRPPFAFLFHYYGGWHGSVQWEDIQSVNQYISQSVIDEIGLPLLERTRYISTDTFPLFSADTSNYSDDSVLTYSTIGFMDDLEQHIEIIEGAFPAVASSAESDSIDVLAHENLALELGLQVGDEFIAYITSETPNGSEIKTQFPLRISGIWHPTDPSETYWISSTSFYERVFFVPEETFSGRISTYLPDEVFSAYWYLVADGSDVHVEDVTPLLVHINTVEKYTNNLLPNIRLSVSPVDALMEYRESSTALTILLYAFSIPILGLILAFISLVSRLSVERRRNEIAILRSRGAAPLQILGMTALEGLVLGLISLGISLPVAVQLTRLITKTRSFLDFESGNSNLRIAISSSSVQIGLFAVFLILLAMVIPAAAATRHTIISYKQETGRVAKAPWWQRSWMDVLLFIPAVYGTYLLQQQGSIAILNSDTTSDPFQNPLLFLVPALGIFALTLFSLRLIHPVMSVVARLASITKNASLTLATRQLSRTPGSYHTPLIILILTVSLSSYTASLAYTLDKHLTDQAYYQTGADIQFVDAGSLASSASSDFGQPQTDTASDENFWVFIPVDEYRKIDGVAGVARLGRYSASDVSKAEGLTRGFFIGVDRIDFPLVSYWREDFAKQSLGTLMNLLAVEQNGVLVDQRILSEGGYAIGDTLSPIIAMYGNSFPVDFKIVGAFDLFPTWYPDQGPLIVGNLDYVFQQMGGEFPYRVLLKTQAGVDPQALGNSDSSSGVPMRFLSWSTPVTAIDQAQNQPERQGLLGFLFIGFMTAALLTVLAFLLYMVFSFQRRIIELGVLRAAGLSIWQMTGYLVWELTFLICIGGVIGTVLGYFASKIFIPFMQIGSEASDLIPPFKVLIAWDSVFQIYWMFGILFVLTLIVSILLLRRMRIFQAIKLGETV